MEGNGTKMGDSGGDEGWTSGGLGVSRKDVVGKEIGETGRDPFDDMLGVLEKI